MSLLSWASSKWLDTPPNMLQSTDEALTTKAFQNMPTFNISEYNIIVFLNSDLHPLLIHRDQKFRFFLFLSKAEISPQCAACSYSQLHCLP